MTGMTKAPTLKPLSEINIYWSLKAEAKKALQIFDETRRVDESMVKPTRRPAGRLPAGCQG